MVQLKGLGNHVYVLKNRLSLTPTYKNICYRSMYEHPLFYMCTIKHMNYAYTHLIISL